MTVFSLKYSIWSHGRPPDLTRVKSCISNLVGHGFLGRLPIVSVVCQGDDEERTPEYQVRHCDHYEHFNLPVAFDNDNCVNDNLTMLRCMQ